MVELVVSNRLLGFLPFGLSENATFFSFSDNSIVSASAVASSVIVQVQIVASLILIRDTLRSDLFSMFRGHP